MSARPPTLVHLRITFRLSWCIIANALFEARFAMASQPMSGDPGSKMRLAPTANSRVELLRGLM